MSYKDLLDVDNKTTVKLLPPSQLEFEVEGDKVYTDIHGTKIRVDFNSNIFSKVYKIPQTFLEDALEPHPTVLKEVLAARARDATHQLYQWSVGRSGKIFSSGPFKKPYIPFGVMGEILREHDLELDGTYDVATGAGIITGCESVEYSGSVNVRPGIWIRAGVNLHMIPTMGSNPYVVPFSVESEADGGFRYLQGRDRIKIINRTVGDVLNDMEEEVGHALATARQMNLRLKALAQEEVDRVSYAERILTIRKVPKRMALPIKYAVAKLSSENSTKYDVLSLIARHANAQEGVRARLKLQGVAGTQAMDGHCSSCGSEVG